MNVVVTSHQPFYLHSLAGEEGEPPKRVYWMNGGPASARNILIVFFITRSWKVFFGPSTFRSLRVFRRSSSL
jgi:hypothetical protein